jgi:hypothetical protein
VKGKSKKVRRLTIHAGPELEVDHQWGNPIGFLGTARKCSLEGKIIAIKLK